jgi:rubrerythrin
MRYEITGAKPVGSTTQIVLRFCLEIETTCANIYSNYAANFADDPMLKKLWAKMAAEELNHAHIIGMAMRCKGLMLKEKDYDLDHFRNSARLIRDIFTDLKSIKQNAEEALRSAINLEQRLKEFHLDHILRFTDPSEEQFFNQLMDGDNLHARQLEDAYQLLLARRRPDTRT